MSYFSSHKIDAYAFDKGINIKYSANYYPQDNDLVESSNKKMLRILKNLCLIIKEIDMLLSLMHVG